MKMTGEAYITRLSTCLPNGPIGNDEMEAILGMVGGRPSRARRIILRSNGIKARYYAIDPATGSATHTNAQLTAAAIRGLAGPALKLEQIDLLACGTTIADQLMPNHASMVHGELGIPPCEIVTTAGVCVSGIMALKYAMLGVRSGEFLHAVATGSEISSAMMRAKNFQVESDARIAALGKSPEIAFEKDFLRWMLSDGAGAALIEPAVPGGGLCLRIDWLMERSYANEQPACMYAGAEKMADGSLKGWTRFDPHEWAGQSIFMIKQDVKQLNQYVAYYTIERALTEVQQLKALNASDIDYFLPHYSSHYFRDAVRESMRKVGFEIPTERWFTNLYDKGNTGSAAMYIVLAELFDSGRLKPGQRLLCHIPESGRFTVAWMHLTVCAPERHGGAQ